MNAKRIFGSALLVATALAGMNLCAAVESDIVGYSTVTIKPGYNMVAVNFDGLGEDAAISIQNLFPGSEGGVYTAGATSGAADKIMVWDADAGEYTTYFLYASKKGTTNREYKWVDAAAATVVAEKTFVSGDSFWYFSRAAADFDTSISGKVVAATEQAITIEPGYNMIGGAFPANFNPNAIDAATWQAFGATAGATSGAADKIMVWDADAGEYTTYFLYASKKGTTDREYRWVNAASASTAVDSAADVMPPAKGAWYFHRGTGYTLTIDSPIAE